MKKYNFFTINYPFENEKLLNYKVRDIRIVHLKNKILFFLKKKDLNAATTIVTMKYNEIRQGFLYNKEEIKMFLSVNNQKIKTNKNDILDEAKKIKENKLIISLESETYDLRNEATTICYFSPSNEYEDSVLDEMLEKFKNRINTHTW